MTCTLKTKIKVPWRDRTIELLVPCELLPGHLGRCDAPKLQAAGLPEPAGSREAVQTTN